MAREWYSRPINSGYTVVDGTTTGSYDMNYVGTWMEYKVIQDETDIANNRSRVDVKMYSEVLDHGASSGMANYAADNYGYAGFDDGNRVYLNTAYNYNNFALNKFADATLTIPHNADGTRTVTLQSAFSLPSSSINGGSASVTIALPTIARGTELVSIDGQYYGYGSWWVLSRKASNLREHITMTCGGTTETVKTTSNDNVNFGYTMPFGYAPNTAYPSETTWTIAISTYNGATLVETKTYTKVWRIREEDKISVYSPLLSYTVEAYNDAVPQLSTDTAVAGFSKVNVKAASSGVLTKYGATIASRVVTFQDGYAISADQTDHISHVVANAGAYSFTYRVTDSRGLYAEITGTYNVMSSSAPTINVSECYRGNNDGTANPSGQFLWATATASCDYLNGHNIYVATVQASGFSAVSFTNGVRVQLASTASPSNAYTVTFLVADLLRSTSVTRTIPSEDIPINIREGGKGVGIGAYCEGEGLISVGYQFSGTIKSKGDRIFGTCNKIDMASLEQGDWDGSNPSIRVHGRASVKASTTYTLSVSGCVIAGVVYLNSSGTMISFENSGNATFTFTTPSGCVTLVPVFKKSDDSAISVSNVSNMQLEDGSSSSPYTPYAMDNVELTDAVRPQVIEAVLLANTSATLDYTGVYITLPSGWWAIDAYAAYYNAIPLKIALYQYQNGFLNLLSVTEIQNGIASQYMHTSCVLNNEQTNDIRVYAQYSSATSNEIRIIARKLV